MALLLPRSVFYHIPRTGGTWVRKAVANAGIPTNEAGAMNDENISMRQFRGRFLHATPKMAPVEQFSFCFVRNPLGWYQSIWAYCTKNSAWNHCSDLLRRCASSTFQDFMRNVLAHCPGHVSRLYQYFLGEEFDCVDFVGKQENLPEDLLSALRMAGESFTAEKIYEVPCVNAASQDIAYTGSCLYTPELLQQVLQAEQECMHKFGYRNEDLSKFVDSPRHVSVPHLQTSHCT